MAGKINKIMVITVTDHRDYPDHFWRGALGNNTNNLVWYDLGKNYLPYGKEIAQKRLLARLKNEKPDFLFLFDSLYYDLDLIFILTQLKNISPNTKSVMFSGDDDLMFDQNRYLALFLDFILVAQIDYIASFKEDGISDAYFITQTKINPFKEKLEKKYDVSFIGTPKSDRNEIIDYLLKNNIKVSLFGSHNWMRYPSLKKIYLGSLSSDEYLKAVNQTKINICLSKNMLDIPHMKGRYLEYIECGAFSLVEDSPQLEMLFKKDKEIVFFKNKEELLKKVEYYLKNEDEREKIARAAYKKLEKNYNFENELTKFLTMASKKSPKKLTLKTNFKIKEINKDFFSHSIVQINEILNGIDYISFSTGSLSKSEFKDSLQVYSLIKNNREISCADYYFNSRFLGNYARFKYCPFGKTKEKDYQPLLHLDQLVLTKSFFIKNYSPIKNASHTGNINFVNDKNTAFVSLPLVTIRSFRKNFFRNPEFYKELSLIQHLYTRETNSKKKKPFKLLLYLTQLIASSLFGKRFIIFQFYKKLSDQNIRQVFIKN